MSKKKNVFVFYTDQQRYDAFGYSGNTIAKTPNIDSLAEDSLVYTRHYASNVDMMPTLLSKCGLEISECVQGLTLLEPGSESYEELLFAVDKAEPQISHAEFGINVYNR